MKTEAIIQHALALANAGLLEEALWYVEAAYEADGDLREVLIRVGVALERSGRLSDAMVCYGHDVELGKVNDCAPIPDLCWRGFPASAIGVTSVGLEAIGYEAARRLFADCVKLVEVEVHSICNRKCWFCPNATHDRRGNTAHLDAGVYQAILADLADIRYAGVLSFSRYNEPLADDVTFGRIRWARETCPDAFLHLNTNGDYLNPQTLDRLVDAGLNDIQVQVYFADPGEPFTTAEAIRRGERMMADVLPASVRMLVMKRRNDYVMWKGIYEGMSVVFRSRDFRVNGTDRGGIHVRTRTRVARRAPCSVPLNAVYVDYNARVVPCCNIRSDIDFHAPFVLGCVARRGDLFRIYGGRKAAAWRRRLSGTGPKLPPCDTCTFAMKPDGGGDEGREEGRG